MPALLLSARQTDDAQLLWRACVALGWQVVRVNGWRVSQIEATDLTVYGEPLFARLVAQTLRLQLHEPPVDWLPNLSAAWRGRDVRLTTLVEAREVASRVFIKPAEEKCFDAKVYGSGGELPSPGPLPEDLAVLVQEVVKWEVEFRCFVLDRKVLTLSPYWRDGASAKAEDGSWPATREELKSAQDFCERLLADAAVDVPKAVVIDVGIIAGKGWAVIESNAAFASGIYGCDPEKVLGVLRHACSAGSMI